MSSSFFDMDEEMQGTMKSIDEDATYNARYHHYNDAVNNQSPIAPSKKIKRKEKRTTLTHPKVRFEGVNETSEIIKDDLLKHSEVDKLNTNFTFFNVDDQNSESNKNSLDIVNEQSSDSAINSTEVGKTEPRTFQTNIQKSQELDSNFKELLTLINKCKTNVDNIVGNLPKRRKRQSADVPPSAKQELQNLNSILDDISKKLSNFKEQNDDMRLNLLEQLLLNSKQTSANVIPLNHKYDSPFC